VTGRRSSTGDRLAAGGLTGLARLARLEPLRAPLRGLAADGEESAITFGRGLAVGLLVGAAIAGSTIWTRIRQARQPTVERRHAP
jgi:hypothetical protein